VRALYEKTIAFILQHIDEHQLREGGQLPTEVALAQQTGVSLVTVRRALAELAAQGIVRREQGRGTFVARPRVRAETTRVGSLRNGLHLDAQSKLETRVLKCLSREAAEEECRTLALASGASVWEISRLRRLNRRPLILETSVIPKLLAPDLGAHLKRSDGEGKGAGPPPSTADRRTEKAAGCSAVPGGSFAGKAPDTHAAGLGRMVQRLRMPPSSG